VDKYRAELENRELLLEMAANNLWGWGWGTNMTFDEAEEWLLKNGWDDISTERQLEILKEVNHQDVIV
jgi:hypothetical protein